MLGPVPASPPPAYRQHLGIDLPTEILHQIFEDTIHLEDPSLTDVRLAQTTIVSCTRVCRHWRYAAFSQKGYGRVWWTSSDNRSAPVSFHHPKDIEESCHLLGVLRLLLQHQHRIREFHVEWCEVEASTAFSNGRPVLALAEFQMPQLEALTWSRKRSGSDEPLPSNTSIYLGPDLIKLERVSIIGTPFRLTSSLCHLTQFTLISPPNRPTCVELAAFFNDTPNIQFLHLNDAVDPDHAAPFSIPAITLPHLCVLAIEGKAVRQMVWKLQLMRALLFPPSEPRAFQVTLPPLDPNDFYREYMEEYLAVMVDRAIPVEEVEAKMQLVLDRSGGCTLSSVVDADPFDTLDFASNGSTKVLNGIGLLPGARAWTLKCAAMGMDRAVHFMRYTQPRTSSLKIRVMDSGCRPNANIQEQRKLAKGLCELHQLTELSLDHDAALLLLPLLALPIDALRAMSLHSFLPRLQHLCLESCDCVAYPELFRNLEMTLDNRRSGLSVLKVTFVRCHVKVHEVLERVQSVFVRSLTPQTSGVMCPFPDTFDPTSTPMPRSIPSSPPPCYQEFEGDYNHSGGDTQSALPIEILHQIFEHASTIHLDYPTLMDVRLAQATIASCTRVCRHWRSVSFSQKELWACMVDVQRQSVPRLRWLLQVSSPHSFNVGHRDAPASFHHPNDADTLYHLDGVVRLLWQHQHRIREFHIEWCSAPPGTTVFETRPILALAELRIPHLEALTWSRGWWGSRELLPADTSIQLGPDLVKLERVSIIGTSFQLTSSCNTLISFTLISPANPPKCREVIAFLQGTPNMQFLHFSEAVDTDIDGLLTLPSLPAVSLPHLTVLNIEGRSVEQMVWLVQFMKALPFTPLNPCAFRIALPWLQAGHPLRGYVEERVAVMIDIALPARETDVKTQLFIDRSGGCTLSSITDGDPFDTLDFTSNGSKKVLNAIRVSPGARAWAVKFAEMGVDSAIHYTRYAQSRISNMRIRVAAGWPNANIEEQRKLAEGLCELHQLTELLLDLDAAFLLLPLLALSRDALGSMSLHPLLPKLRHLCLESCDCVAYPELFGNLERCWITGYLDSFPF
ncbi:hypothetical protein NMY22_g15713 [Coprinellus aureogranulatus]|nr:hypothetical protein NMY22_g15713 [Coprinellus aureogranulatus]